MLREGHVGAALLAYAPLGALAVAAGADDLAIVGAVTAAGLSMLPDVDVTIPFVEHRGPTHTLWFAGCCSVAAGVLGVLAGSQNGALAGAVLGAFAALVVATTVLSHLLADALTPMGVRPFAPWSQRSYSMDLVRARNPLANYSLLAAGVAAAVAALAVGTRLHDILT